MNLERHITFNSDEATATANVANILTPIARIRTPDDVVYYIEPDDVITGFPLKAKLYDAGDNQIPNSSIIAIGIQTPNKRWADYRLEVPYSKFFSLSLNDMENVRFKNNVEHAFSLHPETGEKRFFRLPPRHELVISLLSGIVIDPSKSTLETRVIQRNQ